MEDPYLNYVYCYDRLLHEYELYKSLIIAVDFDDTIYDFHKKGHTYKNVIDLLKECSRRGFKIIILTDNSNHKLIEMYCNQIGIHIEGINKNVIDKFDDCGKIYYNILLDDRAGLPSAYFLLNKLIKENK